MEAGMNPRRFPGRVPAWHLVRALASLAIAFFCCEFLWLLGSRAGGPEGVRAAVACLSSSGAILLNAAILAASHLHAFTWFPKRSSWVGIWVAVSGLMIWWMVR
jgi:fumarate reductase subunit C